MVVPYYVALWALILVSLIFGAIMASSIFEILKK